MLIIDCHISVSALQHQIGLNWTPNKLVLKF